jgi:acyl transferase domain-containing protein
MSSDRQDHASGNGVEPIAIVGVGCRLPGNISTVEDLLAALRDGRDCITEIPPDRWGAEEFYDPDPVAPGKTYVRHGGFVHDIDCFDAAFFGISDSEASRMDPQQRLVLETVWHALENAGQAGEELVQSNTGVFLAMMNTNDYSQLKARFEGLLGITAYDAMGDAMSITAGRIAHFLGVEGPCLALDTACSGSLVALHLARQSILAGDCDAAIVAGVSAILHPGIHMAFSKVGLMSRAGRCAAFDAQADGYIRGEGCMAVVLRRQSAAIARGDHILASIVGSAVNQDGRTPALTAPNGHAQEKVIRTALARRGVQPNEIGYLEAHGTGTPVGDPIEMSAIVNVFGPGRSEPLYVGSVKSNFGHIEAGAGLLGLVKAALSLDHELILPSLHFTRLNPNIDFGHAPVRVPTAAMPWPRGRRRRMAGVNSFGYSGTNAHAILQEAPLAAVDAPAAGADSLDARPSELVVLSAKSAAGLQELADQWSLFLERKDDVLLRDIAFTAATGRTHLSHRLAVIGRRKDEIGDKLRSWRAGRTPAGLVSGQTARRKPKIAFVFTGQGSQYASMGRQLYEMEPCFASAIDRCATLMARDLGQPLREVLFGSSSAALLEDTRYVQPALFAIEYALAALLRHWGVEPDYVIGHSVGELVAACVAGMLTLEDAVKFVVARGRLMGQLPRGGKMLAVDATPAQVREWIEGHEADVGIATINGPQAVVVSGTAAAVDAVAQRARGAGTRMKELAVSHAFHSPLMEPILGELGTLAASLRVAPAKLPVVSNVTGDFHADSIRGDYWSTHVRQPVLFHDGMCKIINAGCSLLIEVGPHPALIPAIASAFDTSKARCVATLQRDQQDVTHLLETLATLFVSGIPLNLDRLFWSPVYRRVSLPLYPFRRDRHWLRSAPRSVPVSDQRPQLPADLHPLLGRAASVEARRVVFESSLATTSPWVDHRVLGSTVFPGTAYLDMAARALAATHGQPWHSAVLREVVFERPLTLAYGKPKKLRLTLDGPLGNGAGEAGFAIAAAGTGGTENHCRGKIASAPGTAERVALDEELNGRDAKLDTGRFYAELRQRGLEYGASFATIRELWVGKPGTGEAVGRITASALEEVADYPFAHVVLLDGCLQVFGAALRTLGGSEDRTAFIPASIQSMTLRGPLPFQVWAHVSVRQSGDGRAAVARIRVLTDGGEVVGDIDGLELRHKASLTTATAQPGTASAAQPRDGLRSPSRAELVEQLRGMPGEKRNGALTKWLASEVKDILGQRAADMDLDNLDPSLAFVEIGLDSLLVTELQRRIQEKLEFRFQPMQGLDYQSIESLAGYILDEVLFVQPAKGAPKGARVKEDTADLVHVH